MTILQVHFTTKDKARCKGTSICSLLLRAEQEMALQLFACGGCTLVTGREEKEAHKALFKIDPGDN